MKRNYNCLSTHPHPLIFMRVSSMAAKWFIANIFQSHFISPHLEIITILYYDDNDGYDARQWPWKIKTTTARYIWRFITCQPLRILDKTTTQLFLHVITTKDSRTRIKLHNIKVFEGNCEGVRETEYFVLVNSWSILQCTRTDDRISFSLTPIRMLGLMFAMVFSLCNYYQV